MLIITQELIDKLDEVFPNQCPFRGTPIEDIYFAAGAASVVDWLKMYKNELDHRGGSQGDTGIN